MSFCRQETPKLNPFVMVLVGFAIWYLFAHTRKAEGQSSGEATKWLIPEQVLASSARSEMIARPDSLVLAKTLVQSRTAQMQLQFMSYFGEDKREYAGCLEGRYVDGEADTVFVSNMALALIDSSEARFISSNYMSCETKNTVGFIHSHPVGVICDVSDGDIWVFFRREEFKRYNLTFLACPSARLVAYSRSDMKRIATENYITRTGKKPQTFAEVLELTLKYALENQRSRAAEFKPKITSMAALFDSVFTP